MDLHTFYAFFIRTQFVKKKMGVHLFPHVLVRTCLHYELIFIAAITQLNLMGAEQIVS